MTQEDKRYLQDKLCHERDKELLLKDLCARLPYGVKLQKTYDTSDPVELYLIDLGHDIIKFYTYKRECLTMCDVGDIERFVKLRYKPYLFPLSSMTEDQSKIYHELIGGMFGTSALINFEALEEFFHKYHLDYRGLIPMGLAIDATGLNIY